MSAHAIERSAREQVSGRKHIPSIWPAQILELKPKGMKLLSINFFWSISAVTQRSGIHVSG